MCHAASRLCVFFPGSEQAAKMVSMEIWCQWCLLAAICHCAASTRALRALRHAHTMRNSSQHCLCLARLKNQKGEKNRKDDPKGERELSHASDKPALRPCAAKRTMRKPAAQNPLRQHAGLQACCAGCSCPGCSPALSALPVALPGTCSWSQCDAIGEEADCLQGTLFISRSARPVRHGPEG